MRFVENTLDLSVSAQWFGLGSEDQPGPVISATLSQVSIGEFPRRNVILQVVDTSHPQLETCQAYRMSSPRELHRTDRS